MRGEFWKEAKNSSSKSCFMKRYYIIWLGSVSVKSFVTSLLENIEVRLVPSNIMFTPTSQKQQAEECTIQTVVGWATTKDTTQFVLHSHRRADDIVLKEHCIENLSSEC